MFIAASKGVPVSLLANATTGTGTAVVCPITSTNPRVHVRGAGTITGGNVIVEESLTPDYTGTWSQISSVPVTPLSGGVEQVIHILGTIGAIRARVSSNVTGGGSVDVDLVCD